MENPTYERLNPGDLFNSPLYDSVVLGVKTPDLTGKHEFRHKDSWETAPGIMIYRRSCVEDEGLHGYFEYINDSVQPKGTYNPMESDPHLSRSLLEHALSDLADAAVMADPNNAWVSRYMSVDEIRKRIIETETGIEDKYP